MIIMIILFCSETEFIAYHTTSNSAEYFTTAFPSRKSIEPPKPSVEVTAEVTELPPPLPPSPPQIAAAVFQEEPSFKVEESPPRTKGDHWI